MGVRHLREAFNNAGQGQVTCTQALLDTAHDNTGEHSILECGWRRHDGAVGLMPEQVRTARRGSQWSS
jgi:hypothetical protein